MTSYGFVHPWLVLQKEQAIFIPVLMFDQSVPCPALCLPAVVRDGELHITRR
jgi:hypothetical protein